MLSKGVAWYDIRGTGPLRDLWVLMHWPYTAWHLSYAVIGAALAPRLNWGTLGWTVLAFFLAMGIGAHCLDELHGRPLKTQIPSLALQLLAIISILGAIAIGIFVGLREVIWLIPCIIFGGFIVFAYSLELFRGFFHYDIWFGIAWGAFPAITAYLAQTGTLSIGVTLLAVFTLLYSMAQRKLSLQARYFRRKVTIVDGYFFEPYGPVNGTWYPITQDTIIGPVDLSLKYLNGAVVVAAVGLLIMHLVKGGL